MSFGGGSIIGLGASGDPSQNHQMHSSSLVSYQGGTASALAAYMNKNSQVSRRSAVTKCSLDDEAGGAGAGAGSDDESQQFLSNFDLIMNAPEFADGQYGLAYVKCFKCDARLEVYSEDVLGGLIVICSTVLHRELNMIASFVIDMIIAIMRLVFQIQIYFS